jgi:DNA mismatch repair protein MutS2
MNEHALRTLEYESIREQLALEASSSLGVEKALNMQPLSDVREIRLLLDETAEARSMIAVKGGAPLGGITDIRELLRQAQMGRRLDASQLLEISLTAGAARSLKGFLSKADTSIWPILTRYGNQVALFTAYENDIDAAIGSKGDILDSASPDLARARSKKRNAESRLRDKLNAILSGSLRSCLQDPVIVQRAGRACLPVKAEHRASLGGIVHDTSSSGATLFIEPAAVVDLGNEVREMEALERSEIERILLKLTDHVRRIATSFWGTLNVLANIDFIVARARYADRLRAVEPEINTGGVTRLLSARHPLIDPEKVVPIDIVLGEAECKILLITGPNTGGKTVTLKTVGLLTLMAQSGLHLPAMRAAIHVFDQIFSDIGDEQSIQQSLSTFSSHMSNIASILKSIGSNALVLFDELGAGTDPEEGAAIAQSILSYLLRRNACAIATSHYGELKTFAFSTDGIQNASVEFDEQSLRPTYRLLQGIPGSSNAISIAGRIGVPEEALLEARGLLTGERDDSANVIRALEEAKRQALNEAEEAQKALKEAREIRDKAQEELSHYEQLRHEIRSKALDEARSMVRKAQEKAAGIVSDIKRQAKADSAGRAGSDAGEKLRDLERNISEDLDSLLSLPRASEFEKLGDAPRRALKTGDRVRVPGMSLAGVLLEDPSDKQKVSVQVGRLRVMSLVDGLTLLGEKAEAPQPVRRALSTIIQERSGENESSGEASIMEAASVSSQLTLLGQRVDDALMNLDRYLDSAHAAGVKRLRVVHGKGTGALRRAVHDHLKNHPYVDEFSLANPDEGGAGATVVTMMD